MSWVLLDGDYIKQIVWNSPNSKYTAMLYDYESDNITHSHRETWRLEKYNCFDCQGSMQIKVLLTTYQLFLDILRGLLTDKT